MKGQNHQFTKLISLLNIPGLRYVTWTTGLCQNLIPTEEFCYNVKRYEMVKGNGKGRKQGFDRNGKCISSWASELFTAEDRACHAHDNSADSENVAGAREPNVHVDFIFCFENGQENQSSFSIHAQNTAETSQPQALLTDDRRAIDMAIPLGLQWPWEKFASARLCRKTNANFIDSRKLLLRGYKLKKPNTTDLERDLQRPRPRWSTIDRRRWMWTPSAGQSTCFFFLFFFSFSTIA